MGSLIGMINQIPLFPTDDAPLLNDISSFAISGLPRYFAPYMNEIPLLHYLA